MCASLGGLCVLFISFPFVSSTPHVGLCLPANALRFTLGEVAREGEQQARALFKHGTCGGTAAHLCGNIREALAQGKAENEDESRASGKPVRSLTL